MYGYYLAESGVQKPIFEFLQRNLEEKTDALHELIEKDIVGTFFANSGPRRRVANLPVYSEYSE